jgi:hypothetical protein
MSLINLFNSITSPFTGSKSTKRIIDNGFKIQSILRNVENSSYGNNFIYIDLRRFRKYTGLNSEYLRYFLIIQFPDVEMYKSDDTLHTYLSVPGGKLDFMEDTIIFEEIDNLDELTGWLESQIRSFLL